jgi:hypothetical protein
VLALVVGSLLGAGGVVAFRRGQSDPSPRAYHRWFDGPTRGDRASDPALREAALEAWTEAAARGDGRSPQKHLLDHPTSPPRVVWAGTVADTAAAVVVQRADITPKEIPGLDEGIPPGSDVWGFLRIDPSGVARIGTVHAFIGGDVPRSGVLGGWVDPDRGLGLLFDLGVPLEMSNGIEVLPDGRYGRTAHPVWFTSAGVSVIKVDSSTPLAGVEVGSKAARPNERYALDGSAAARPKKHLAWSVPHGHGRAPVVPISGLPTAGTPQEVTVRFGDAFLTHLGDEGSVNSYGTGPWAVAGRLADGTSVIVSAFDLDGAARIALLLGSTYVDEGSLDVAKTLPVAVRLPGGRGWVVASPRATLRYRQDGGHWRAAGFEAALVPDVGPGHLDVEVTWQKLRSVVRLR